MGSPIKKGSKKNKEVPKQPRVWKNQSPRQTKAWDKQGSWMSEVREWAYTYPWKWGPWNTKDVGQMRSPNKWSPQTNNAVSPDNKSPEQKRSSNKCSPPKEQGPPTVEVPKQLRSINKQLPEWTNTFMNIPVVRIVIVVPTLKWSCHVSTNSHEKQFHGNTLKRALCSFHLYVF